MNSSTGARTAWDEIAETGLPGPACVEVLVRLIRQVARGKFPPPPQHQAWTKEASQDAVADLILSKGWVELISAAAASATDQRSFELVLLRTIRNWFIDQAKATVAGKMRRRLQTLLAQDNRFEPARRLLAEDGWTQLAFGDDVWVGDSEVLFLQSAHFATEPLDELNSAGRTSTANRVRILGYLAGVFHVALGAIREQLLAVFVVNRFGLDESEVAADLERAGNTSDGVGDAVAAREAARRLLDRLADEEKAIIALGDDVDAVASHFGWSTAKARARIDDVTLTVRGLCASSEAGKAGFLIAREQCSKLLSGNTSSVEGVEGVV